jgi:hypothetical protein
MTLSERLAEYVRACFAGLWIQSFEHEDALAEINQLCRDEQWPLAVWDIDRGLQVSGQQNSATDSAHDPLAAIRAAGSLASPDGAAVLVLVNFHRFLQSAEIVQALAHQVTAGKQSRTIVVILSPVIQLPVELEKHFTVLEHELPDRDQLEAIARGVATQSDELPQNGELASVLDAAAGLTRYEAENAYSLSLVRDGRLSAPTVWDLKTQGLKKGGLLSVHRGQESFANLGGLSALKAFCARAMRRQGHQDPLRRPRGVLLLSPPGCGKSSFAKALGNETGRPTIILDVGSLMGSLVGQSEERTRQALRTIDAIGCAVLMLDELEKSFSGVAASGSGDSGVSARMFGTFLTWLSDHTSDVFVIATVNSISKLPPEFARAERFDGVFFLDLPSRAEKDEIWRLYIERFGLDSGQPCPKDENWSGAEIRACCRLAALLDVPLSAAAQNIVPVAVTAAESVEQLRQWASGRCLAADRAGIYTYRQGTSNQPRRRISRDASSN